MCLGVTAGAYILTLFAVCLLNYGKATFHMEKFADSLPCLFWLQIKYRERVHGLILVSPICKAPSWKEWLFNKVLFESPIIFVVQEASNFFLTEI